MVTRVLHLRKDLCVVCLVAVLGISPWGHAGDAVWEQAGYSAGGLFPIIVADPGIADVVYLGSDVSGVYKSTDAGDHWISVSTGLESLAITSITVNPADSSEVWAGTALGLHRTENGGDSWSRVFVDTDSDGVEDVECYINVSHHAIAIDTDGQTILAAGNHLEDEYFENLSNEAICSGRLYRSTNGGRDWERVQDAAFPAAYRGLAIGTRFPTVSFDPDTPGQAFLQVNGNGILRTVDGGGSWQEFAAGLPADRSNLNWKQFAIGQQTIYATATSFDFDNPTVPTHVFKSGKGTASWTDVGSGPSNGLGMEDNDDGGLPLTNPIAVSPSDDATIILSHNEFPSYVFKSNDGGTSWAGLAIEPGVNFIFNYEATPFRRFIDPNEVFISMAFDSVNANRIYASGWWDIWRSDDGGASWTQKPVGTQNTVCNDVFFAGDRMFQANWDTLVQRSDDFGAGARSCGYRTDTGLGSGAV
ncbi:MAG: hypothetical protein L3K26_16575 [Candidatus Hydrogenedentes bacterium]|nr:hypothetical protein [Candidatus Hydrogenedentota bacterium]